MKRQSPNGRTTPTFRGLSAASARSAFAAMRASKKADTRCELELRRALRRCGLRCRAPGSNLPGRPDLVFPRARVVVFCDGDFWHGRELETRLHRLAKGHNSEYWIAKLKSNVARDAARTRELEAEGWLVLRFWETDIRRAPEAVALQVVEAVSSRRPSPAAYAGRIERAAMPRPSPG